MSAPRPNRDADATATVAVRVPVPPERAFVLFVHDLDRWWRRGPKFRHSGHAPGSLHLEPKLDGRVFERCGDGGSARDVAREFELGRIVVFEPPHRLRFTWRNATFAAAERTEVDVTFAPSGDGTLVTVRHHGWHALRPDHPARHGLADAALARSVGLWWGELLAALREFATSQP